MNVKNPMPKITIHTSIQAPIELCFDLARDAAFHVESARETGERIVAGRSSGHFQLGDTVVFEGRHLGVRQRLGAKIIEMEVPHYFIDEMTSGIFVSLSHLHRFETISNTITRMTDVIEWKSPLGLLGTLADMLLVKRHLRQFLIQRCRRIKERAEAQTSTL